MFQINEGTIDLPKEWKDESINVLTASQGSGPGFSFTISRDTLPWGMEFASFASKEVDAIASNLKDYHQIASEPTEVDGQEAVLSEFRWTSAQGPIHQCMVITAKERKALIFTASMPGMISGEQKRQILSLVATFQFRREEEPAGSGGPESA